MRVRQQMRSLRLYAHSRLSTLNRVDLSLSSYNLTRILIHVFGIHYDNDDSYVGMLLGRRNPAGEYGLTLQQSSARKFQTQLA